MEDGDKGQAGNLSDVTDEEGAFEDGVLLILQHLVEVTKGVLLRNDIDVVGLGVSDELFRI